MKDLLLRQQLIRPIIFAISPRLDTKCKIHSEDLSDDYEFDICDFGKSQKSWPNYLLGVVHQLKQNGYKFTGFDCVFGGDIPIGAGLSSSAAIEAGLGYALSEMFQLNVPRLEIVKMSQLAEL